MAGRGFGKTRCGAEWVRAQVKAGRRRIALVGPTAADARNVMVEGESGILAIPEVDALIEQQSAETNSDKRKELVWQIERKLVQDAVRPIIFFMRQGTCWQPEVKGLTLMENSIFNSWRMEDVWLDKQ
jgi:ABC-type transport system substrate-binding protein